jgi:hypothetical protein
VRARTADGEPLPEGRRYLEALELARELPDAVPATATAEPQAVRAEGSARHAAIAGDAGAAHSERAAGTLSREEPSLEELRARLHAARVEISLLLEGNRRFGKRRLSLDAARARAAAGERARQRLCLGIDRRVPVLRWDGAMCSQFAANACLGAHAPSIRANLNGARLWALEASQLPQLGIGAPSEQRLLLGAVQELTAAVAARNAFAAEVAHALHAAQSSGHPRPPSPSGLHSGQSPRQQRAATAGAAASQQGQIAWAGAHAHSAEQRRHAEPWLGFEQIPIPRIARADGRLQSVPALLLARQRGEAAAAEQGERERQAAASVRAFTAAQAADTPRPSTAGARSQLAMPPALQLLFAEARGFKTPHACASLARPAVAASSPRGATASPAATPPTAAWRRQPPSPRDLAGRSSYRLHTASSTGRHVLP